MAPLPLSTALTPHTHAESTTPNPQPPPLYHATLGLASTYRAVEERRGKVRPRGGWAGTATGETRLFTSEDGTLRLGPHLPLLMGRYRFLRLVGQGTFAQIVRAEDTLHPGRRQVAIKILNFHYGEIGKREALCLRVAHEAGGGEGPHAAIVRLLGAFDFLGHFCLVLELCLGGSLQAFVKPLAPPPPAFASPASSPAAIAAMPTLPTARGRGPGHGGGAGGGTNGAGMGMALPQLREVALHLVKALLLLHNSDVIHADLKPENVLLLSPPPRAPVAATASATATGAASASLGPLVRLTDLGNAIKSREVKLYKEDYEIQTLGYRAPEVLVGGCGGRAFDHGIDMWSLGVLLVELHLGRPLFRAASKTLMVKRILSILGPLPARAFVTGKFYAALFGPDHRLRPEALALRDDAAHAATALVDPASVQNSFRYDAGAHHRLVCDLLRTRDRGLIGFVGGLLQLDPAARLTSLQALMHPFLMPCFPFALLRPHLAPAALDGLREQQRRQQQGDERARAAIRPGQLFVARPPKAEAVAAAAAAVEAVADSGASSSTGGSTKMEAPDSDGPHPTPSSTPALSLGPESPPRPSEEEEDEEEREEDGDGAQNARLKQEKQEQQQKGEGRKASSRKRPRDERRPREPKPAPPAGAAASSPANPTEATPVSVSKPPAKKWWELGDDEDEDEIVDERPRAVRRRPFAEEKAGGREEGSSGRRRRRPSPPRPSSAAPARSSLEAAAAGDRDDISEDELVL